MDVKKEGLCCSAQLRHLWASFVLDRRFAYVFLLEIALILTIIGGYAVLSIPLNNLSDDLSAVSSAITSMSSSDFFAMQQLKGDISSFYAKIVTYLLIYVIFGILVVASFKSLIYTIVNRTKMSKSFFWRFTVTTVVWSLLSFLVIYLTQSILFRLFFGSIEKSIPQQILVILILSVLTFVLFYLSVVLFTEITLSCNIRSGLRSLLAALKGFKLFMLPLLFSMLVFAAVNFVVYFVMKLPKNISTILATACFIMFLVWLRFYYTSLCYKISSPEHTAKKTEKNKVHHKRK